jgi:hypothetical protein
MSTDQAFKILSLASVLGSVAILFGTVNAFSQDQPDPKLWDCSSAADGTTTCISQRAEMLVADQWNCDHNPKTSITECVSRDVGPIDPVPKVIEPTALPAPDPNP